MKSEDVVRLKGAWFGSSDEVLEKLAQVGGDVVLRISDDATILFRNMTVDQFDASMFDLL